MDRAGISANLEQNIHSSGKPRMEPLRAPVVFVEGHPRIAAAAIEVFVDATVCRRMDTTPPWAREVDGGHIEILAVVQRFSWRAGRAEFCLLGCSTPMH